MYAITGVTGRVGGAAAHRLLGCGAPVRAVVRDGARGQVWVDRGAELAVADLDDRAALAKAFSGSAGVFVMLPFDLAAVDFHAETCARVASIAGAVADSGVPHVVVLSSLGAELSGGTGPIVGLHDLEEALGATDAAVTALRSTHFQEKVVDVLGAVMAEGIYPVFASSADVPHAMVATRDIGEFAAEALRDGPDGRQVIDVLGPSYTEREVAAALGEELGRDLDVSVIPREHWTDVLEASGAPRHMAELLERLYAADDAGLLGPQSERRVSGTTELRSILGGLVRQHGSPA